MQHDYHIATQAKFTALNELIEQQAAELIEQQAAQIEALRNKLKQIDEVDWLPGRVRTLIKEALTGKVE